MMEKEIKLKCNKCGEVYHFRIHANTMLKEINIRLICNKCSYENNVKIVFIDNSIKPQKLSAQETDVIKNPAPDIPIDIPSEDIREIIDE